MIKNNMHSGHRLKRSGNSLKYTWLGSVKPCPSGRHPPKKAFAKFSYSVCMTTPAGWLLSWAGAGSQSVNFEGYLKKLGYFFFFLFFYHLTLFSSSNKCGLLGGLLKTFLTVWLLVFLAPLFTFINDVPRNQQLRCEYNFTLTTRTNGSMTTNCKLHYSINDTTF